MIQFFVFFYAAVYVQGALQNANPYLTRDVPSSPFVYSNPSPETLNKLRQNINQWQVAVVLPPGGQYPKPPETAPGSPGTAPPPGSVWIQIPASYLPGYQPQEPVSPPILPPVPVSPPISPPAPIYPPISPPGPISPPAPIVPPVPLPVPVAPGVPGIQQPAQPDENPLIKWCLYPRGQFPSEACNTFINCWDGNAIEQFCPEELVFNPVGQGYCDYGYNFDCKGKPIKPFPLPPVTNVTDGSDGSWIPDPVLPVQPNPPTLPPIIGPIIPPAPVPLPAPAPIPLPAPAPVPLPGPVSVPTLPPAPTVDPILRKKCLKPRGQFPSIQCNKYVNCWDDVVIEQECPEGLLFSSKGYCDFPYNVDCNDRTVTYPKSQNHLLCHSSDGTFRSRDNCAQFYTCVANQVVAKYDCPEGYKFNDRIGVCDMAERVDCNNEPYMYPPARTNNLLTGLPEYSDANCVPGTVSRLNNECTSASLCRNGYTEVVHCPNGLSYDSATDRCLQPYLARC